MTGEARTGFASGDRALPCRVAIVTGVCRSGKTLLGNLLGTVRHVEHVDEPWLPMILPMAAEQGLIDEAQAVRMWRAHVADLLNDVILLRAVSFRPSDLSFVGRRKSEEEIAFRLDKLRSRADALAYAAEHDTLLLLNLAETIPFVSFLRKAAPDAKVVHVVRHGLSVAAEVEAKGWLSDAQLAEPVNAQLYRDYRVDGTVARLPWWVHEGEERLFTDLSTFGRGLYYWTALLERGAAARDALNGSGAWMEVKYEALTAEPGRVLSETAAFFGVEPSDRTDEALGAIRKPDARQAAAGFDELPRELRRRADTMLSALGYDRMESD